MDDMSAEEVKDRIKFFKICERFARKYANKYEKTEQDRVLAIHDLAVSFLGNMTFRFFTYEAQKSDYLMMIKIINNMLQQWYVDALNQLELQ